MSGIKKIQQLMDQQMEVIQVSQSTGSAILNGIKLAQRKKQRKTKIVFSLSAVAVLFLGFTFMTRISPAFAQVFESIPGLGAIVAIVEYDRGVEDSVQNNYFEEIGVSNTENEVTFTLDGVIADETGMLLSYTLESPRSVNDYRLGKTVLLQNEEELGLVYVTSDFAQDEQINEIKNTIRISDPSSVIDYSNPSFELEVSVIGQEELKFVIPFTLNNKIAKPKKYNINQEVVVAGQKFTVEQVKISPLHAAIEIETDNQNDMVIFDFLSIELQDGDGDMWGNGSSSISGFGSADNTKRTFFLESSYFQEPKELFLVIGDLVALPKDEREVVIDFGKKEVVSMSEQYPLQLENISEEGFAVRLDEHLHYKQTLFNNGLDTNGKNIAIGVSNRFSDTENFQVFTLEKGMYENPVTFELQGYPNYLENDISIKIK
ncbi:DUF4179 domain-containing protein [Psychrobacillus sp. Sa2BUA9]|uniref:DUF4179 domain-containing protein n=1 Tax=Psychrobacillus faecigallinarum TaxID=2762235 RepID=A0ABR8RE26_9BACI|nr:DUF4179 domain-containing protein [Psychrobacillus faecigallinarum]MBD7946011.1 DUF4179 domain-containing protein [Psychrobacillus faecigallinarum]